VNGATVEETEFDEDLNSEIPCDDQPCDTPSEWRVRPKEGLLWQPLGSRQYFLICDGHKRACQANPEIGDRAVYVKI
jgi:hypothetical protein